MALGGHCRFAARAESRRRGSLARKGRQSEIFKDFKSNEGYAQGGGLCGR